MKGLAGLGISPGLAEPLDQPRIEVPAGIHPQALGIRPGQQDDEVPVGLERVHVDTPFVDAFLVCADGGLDLHEMRPLDAVPAVGRSTCRVSYRGKYGSRRQPLPMPTTRSTSCSLAQPSAFSIACP